MSVLELLTSLWDISDERALALVAQFPNLTAEEIAEECGLESIDETDY